ncbi:MAG: GIY-YIG nuclease family protein [Desulfosudaceae bacterium]
MKATWYVYLLECADHTLYCGVTTDLANRLQQHQAGEGAKYTRSRRPVKLVAHSQRLTKSKAFQLEYFLKKQPRARKKDFLKAASCL